MAKTASVIVVSADQDSRYHGGVFLRETMVGFVLTKSNEFSIRSTLPMPSSPGLTRSRACPTSALLNDRNRKHPISIGDPVATDLGYWIARSSRAMTLVRST